MDDPSYDDAIKKSHHAGMDQVGPDVGTPVISDRRRRYLRTRDHTDPRGEEAGRLWDGVRLVTGVPGFYELKRGRTESPELRLMHPQAVKALEPLAALEPVTADPDSTSSSARRCARPGSRSWQTQAETVEYVVDIDAHGVPCRLYQAQSKAPR